MAGVKRARWPLLLALAVLPLAGERCWAAGVSASQTMRFPVSAGGGAVRVEHSYGEIDIEGWDRPEVEVTVERASEREAGARSRAAMEQRIGSVTVAARREGNDVVISTAYPARSVFTHPLSRRSDVEIRYEIHAPRAWNLRIHGDRGGVNISGIHGAIEAGMVNGQITVTVAPGAYSIDARCGFGTVYTDVGGADRARRRIREEVAGQASSDAVRLSLQTRLGDIVILERSGPAD